MNCVLLLLRLLTYTVVCVAERYRGTPTWVTKPVNWIPMYAILS
jgi:hypothetical protein